MSEGVIGLREEEFTQPQCQKPCCGVRSASLGFGWDLVHFVANSHTGTVQLRVAGRQVKLAVFLVFEGVQRALPVLAVAVAALDAGLFDCCWHVGFPLVRW